MSSCSCSCGHKPQPAKIEVEEPKSYVCIQCNTFKTIGPNDPRPECCSKPMQDMD